MQRHCFYLILALALLSAFSGQAHDLVDIQVVQPKIRVDSRSVTDKIFIERFVAHRLGRVQYDLAKEGLGLVIYGGYRSPSIQKLIEAKACKDCCPRLQDEAEHYRKGLGVDVAIYYLDEQPIELPSEYEDRSHKAYRDYYLLSAQAYHNSALLEEIMCRYGFVPMREKWWHFDLRGWEEAPLLDVEYDTLVQRPNHIWE